MAFAPQRGSNTLRTGWHDTLARMDHAERFPVIVGPTAGGKTALAVEVALRLGVDAAGELRGEVVTADSIQIYRGLDIGSAKPTPEERGGVRHHLIDIVEPTDEFTVHDWLRAAEACIADIRARGHVPIVVGGTHLYVKGFIDGMFEGPGADEALRVQLRARGLTALREELSRVDPSAAAKIHPNDERRTIRALEVFLLTGKPISEHQRQWDQPTDMSCQEAPSDGGAVRVAGRRRDCVLVGLDWPTEAINRRINARVRQMIDAGLVEECRTLHAGGRLGIQAREALGYKQLIEHLERRCSLDDAIEEIKIQTRRFAKNQRTWLKRLRLTPGSVWINAEETPSEQWPDIVLAAMKAVAGR